MIKMSPAISSTENHSQEIQQERPPALPVALSDEELKAVAGGPEIKNNP